ncbi:arabinogalactan endo-1,4-beta-galactosidase [Lewinella aquimaris]|uniref:Arabinogalactan endo-beta-1,4-galactanase n=1 Tax=Neolewinella aquimaris TaxID=1835722 RepID=A0A840EBL0_9BACT|nr:glycosyl hydrolase 53 family protein [Neolewinella aquimaris]MBB4080915.1 arabinogalactan endo-1,4-beta-galactosidase [Neolewinella aquimaris]
MKPFFLLPLLCFTSLLTGQCMQGVDLSYVNAIEQAGGIYYDTAGVRVDPYQYFAERGAEMVRIRLWHTPENNQSDCGEPITSGGREDVLLAARKIDSSGMGLNLAIHYGDYFVDPGKQERPQAWDGLSGQTLLDSIYHYTYRTLELLHAQGTDPVIVAVGNETDNGFVDATVRTNGFEWADDAAKFNAGLRAVREFNTTHGTTIRSAIHLTEGYARAGVKEFTDAGVTDFDVIGLSYYPHFNPRTTIGEMGELVGHLIETYGKEVMVFETGFSHNNTGGSDDYNNFLAGNGEVSSYPPTPSGQRDFLLALNEAICAAGGTAIFYWEPAWITSEMCDAWGQGSSYENASWFDYESKALPAFDWLGQDATVDTRLEENEALGINFFPNPLRADSLRIESDLPVREWRLLDMRGAQVAAGETKTTGVAFTVYTGRLAPGTYVIRLKLDDGRWVTRKLMASGQR